MASAADFLEGSGLLARKTVPDNNSCLFTSLNYLLNDKRPDYLDAQFLRDIVAKEIEDNPSSYSEAALGMTHSAYAAWIRNPQNWGGAIDTFVLCKHFSMEIVVVDSLSGTIIRFGEAMHFSQRAFVYYDGIHYDPLEYETDFSPTMVVFPTTAAWMLSLALQLAKDGHQAGDFVNVNTFNLKCRQCSVLLVGEKELSRHALATSHNQFEEYKPS